ncbi:unnamed protein product, partial [marine sediment metagenome]
MEAALSKIEFNGVLVEGLHTLELENPDLHSSLLQVFSFSIDSLGDLDILDGHAGQIGYRNLVVIPPT